jgi:dTDP-4-dehydrorhamnose reductase
MKTVLVTGANGQLGRCLQDIAGMQTNLDFVFKSAEALDITDVNNINTVFKEKNFDFCINCAAYTAVDKAEAERDIAKEINTNGAKNIAAACVEHKATLLHISTDFVFDGNKSSPYDEKDKENPINVYGITKLNGEREIAKILKEHFIVRTSWLFSEYGNNFLKTILRLNKEKESLSIVADQIGTPTYARDLANIIIQFILLDVKSYGTYHFSNEGVASWYDFAKAILDQKESKTRLEAISAEEYPMLAQRPKYSVLDKTKLKWTLDAEIPNWMDGVEKVISNLDLK